MSQSTARKRRRILSRELKKAEKANAPREKTIQKQITDWINAHPLSRAIIIKPDGAGIPKGTPDILASVQGITVWIETKRPGSSSTPIQKFQQRMWAKTGAIVFEAHSLEEAQKVVQALIDSFTMAKNSKDLKRVKRMQRT